MTEREPHSEPAIPTGAGEHIEGAKYHFALAWIQRLDPGIFSPLTLVSGGTTHIRLRSPDASIDIGVLRTVRRYTGGAYQISDSTFRIGNNNNTRLNYDFSAENTLEGYSSSAGIDDQMDEIVENLRLLITYPGAVITADHSDFGAEASLKSDGEQWIDLFSDQAIELIPSFAIDNSLFLH